MSYTVGYALSRQWARCRGFHANGSIICDIPISQVEKVRLYREHKMLHNVEDPRVRDNDYLYPDIKDPDAQETEYGRIHAFKGA
jgi:hypothetical protein